jgi:Nif-specific regulatory protein
MLSKIDINKFNTLIEINTLINSNFKDIHRLLSYIMESAVRLSDAEASSLLLTKNDKDELFFEVAFDSKDSQVKKFTVKPGEGIAGWVAYHNKPLIVNDTDNNKHHLTAGEINNEAGTMMAVPMRIKDKCTGVIEVINKKNGGKFTRDDIEWLEIFANQASVAIINARSMENAENETELLENKLKDSKSYHTMITKSPVILEKLEIIDRAAKTDLSVLLLGESGVGKELFAEQIHMRSQRRLNPFIRVNCASLPEGLLESELFGHVKGAFTSAVSGRQGRFEMADNGTIFFDEIGDLPLSLQGKILRVIQERKFEKVGSDTTITVNVRILAATNKDIEAQVERGEFRSDLYYRLNVLPVFIPPLRQRQEDILELARFFLDSFMHETKKQFDGFSHDAVRAMLTYPWPGNVRELQNSIERACVIGKNKLIGPDDLFLKSSFGNTESETAERNLKNAVNIFKSGFIRKVLEENNWNQTETSKALAIQRTYLSRLIKELNIGTSKK